jgi:demethylmenaquinone methyltransferase/2-methoxy-6-polyprenyl-1,4-benzoquinol methylase
MSLDLQEAPVYTNFGYQQVTEREKTAKVNAVFSSVAGKYDLMNDLMSLGIHHFWKKLAIQSCNLRPGNQVLDIAAGTCDLSKAMTRLVGTTGNVVALDLNPEMLQTGRDKLLNAGVVQNINFIVANAERIPLAANSFDCISIAFGLRNVTNKAAALKEMQRLLKPGGRLVILEFSHPQNQHFKQLYDLYSFKILPKLGKLIANDQDSYQYLVESIRMHPTQEELKALILSCNFDDCSYRNLTNGIAAIHVAYKY